MRSYTTDRDRSKPTNFLGLCKLSELATLREIGRFCSDLECIDWGLDILSNLSSYSLFGSGE